MEPPEQQPPSAEVPPPPTGTIGSETGSLPQEPARAPKRSRGKLVALVVALLVIAGAVAGIVVAASGGGGKPVSAVESTSPAAPGPSVSPEILPPVGFTATGSEDPFGVVMTWSAPVGQPLQGYRIYRQGVQIAAVPPSTTTYTDSNVQPGESYRYEILTRGTGLFQSDRVGAMVEVPVPSLASARAEGTFNAKFKTTSQTGYVGSLGSFTLRWKFTPKCGQGACNVTLKDLSIKDLKATLTRKGVNYSGTDSAKFLGSCGGTAQTSSLTVAFHVVNAEVIGGEWRASKLKGTVVESHPSAHGCTSGGATFTVTITFLN